MKNALLAIAIIALIPSVGHGAVYQSQGFFDSQTTTAITTTLTSATQSGDALILACANYIDTKHPTSFVAGAATASTADATYTDTSDNYLFSFYSIPNVAGGITSVTVNMSATAFIACIVVEESGLASSAILDQASTGNRQTGTTTWSSNSVTTTNANDIALGFAFIPGTGITFTAGASWAQLSGTGLTNGAVSETGANTTELFGERQPLSSTGTYSATGGGPNDTYISMILTYKVATVTSNPPPPLFVIQPSG